MNSSCNSGNSDSQPTGYQGLRQFLPVGVSLIVLLIGGDRSWAGGVVNNCTEADLRAAMAGGGTVTFAYNGTITLTSTITNTLDTVLDGTGRQITVSGGNSNRVFYVESNATFVLRHLTIAQGRSTNGAGLFNAGTVNATNVTFQDNQAVGTPNSSMQIAGGDGTGGALANSGVANLAQCTFAGNSANGGGGGSGGFGSSMPGYPGGVGAGGAIWNSGTLIGDACTFTTNSAQGGGGGWGSPGGSGLGAPGAGGNGGDGAGGALFNSGAARLVNCTFAFNLGQGGDGGMGGDNFPFARGPNGSPGSGIGAICDPPGQCHLTNCTIAFNSCDVSSSGALSIGGIKTAGGSMVNTLLSDNVPNGNCLGAINDLGHNLSSDMSCGFTNTGSLNNTYPLLGPLTNNGGATATVAPLAGSRAIDAGDTAAAPLTDQRGVARPYGAAADIGACEYNSPGNPGPSGIVTECTEASLRAAISGGGTVTFACDGMINLSSTLLITRDTLLQAANHQVAISGSRLRLFQIGSNITFSLSDVTLTNGYATNGAGILNTGGFVRATNCVFAGNYAFSSGAALRNEAGDVFLSGCLFVSNRVEGVSGTGGSPGWGGALENLGSLTADLCNFAGNSVVGGRGYRVPWRAWGWPGGPGGDARGGAIWNSGTLALSRCTFTNNSAAAGVGADGWPGILDILGGGGYGGSGGSGGNGKGGALYNIGTARIAGTLLAYNTGAGANGGAGGAGGAGGGGTSGGNGGNGGDAGSGVGAVFSSGVLSVVNSTFAYNTGSGGAGGAGGGGGSGTFGGKGADGGNGGSGFGAIDDQSSCGLTNATLALNSGTTGAGGAAGPAGIGQSQNGSAGTAGSPGSSGGGIRGTNAKLVNTLMTQNAPDNVSGSTTSVGPNLSSSMLLVEPLTDNGGPTLTMAPLPGSPAVGAASAAAASATDQRGFPRPAGSGPDIGAFELGSIMPTVTEFRADAEGVTVTAGGNAGQSCRLLTSADLVNWIAVATNAFDNIGSVVFHQSTTPGAYRFYQLVMP
jgi:hypothetical protein